MESPKPAKSWSLKYLWWSDWKVSAAGFTPKSPFRFSVIHSEFLLLLRRLVPHNKNMSNPSVIAQLEVNTLIFLHLWSLMVLEAMKFCNGSVMSLPVRFAMQIGIVLMQVYVYWKVFIFLFFFLY